MRRPVRGMKVADKYELVEEIGRGGMGVVWRAYASTLGLHCALKMLLPGFGRERDRLRLLREARSAAKLNSPYVVTIYDVGEWHDYAFIAMELLDGQSLDRWLATEGRISAAQTLELVRQVSLGLEKAHAQGLVHRDLKPDNIFVVEREPLLVKLLDFGVVKQLRADPDEPSALRSIAGAVVGTPRYMSPEQAAGAVDLDLRSDLWSLAVVAFECLTGRLPFDGETWPHVLVNICWGPIPIPSQVSPDVAPGFDAFWAQAAMREPAARPQSARAFAELLRKHLETPPAELLPASPVPAPQQPAQDASVRPRPTRLLRGRWFVGAAAMGLGAAAGLGYLLVSTRAQHVVDATPEPAQGSVAAPLPGVAQDATATALVEAAPSHTAVDNENDRELPPAASNQAGPSSVSAIMPQTSRRTASTPSTPQIKPKPVGRASDRGRSTSTPSQARDEGVDDEFGF